MPDMLKLSEFDGVKNARKINLDTVAQALTEEQRKTILSGVDMRQFVKIFEDEETMRTAKIFFANGMNISATARALYMHRNTLIYRLRAIYKKTGLNLHNFEMAITFKLLYSIYKVR